MDLQSGYAVLAAALLVTLVAALAILWRWFVANRTRLVELVATRWQTLLTTSIIQHLKARYPRVWGFVARRFARGEYLGLHLTVGLTISLIGLWVFAAITEDVIHHDPITRFDLALLDWLQAHATPAGHAIARNVSELGSGLALTAMALVVAVLLAVRRRGLLLEGWLTAFLGGELLNQALKRAIQRPRPFHSAILSSQSWSFPSGHAMGSLIGYGMLAYVLITLTARGKRYRVAIVVVATLLVLAIGFSRLYLGVHYFSDVIGGFGAGLLWLAACISGLEVARRWGERATQ
jgi:membrane-associated phospholipid phosphatase